MVTSALAWGDGRCLVVHIFIHTFILVKWSEPCISNNKTHFNDALNFLPVLLIASVIWRMWVITVLLQSVLSFKECFLIDVKIKVRVCWSIMWQCWRKVCCRHSAKKQKDRENLLTACTASTCWTKQVAGKTTIYLNLSLSVQLLHFPPQTTKNKKKY